MNIYKTTWWVIVHRNGPMEHNMYKTLQILLHNVSNKVIVYVQLYAYHVHFVANKPVTAQVTHASHMQCIQLHTACDTCNTAQRGRQTSHCKVIHISHLLITTARIYRWDYWRSLQDWVRVIWGGGGVGGGINFNSLDISPKFEY